jgi:hypothetical protein
MGVLKYKNGEIYEGRMANGKPEGKGSYGQKDN